jgi:HEPN domain-containing protein
MQKIDIKTFKLIKLGFVNAGYDDYIASRFLLNNGFFEQGVTLACYAVERYIKSVLLLLGMPLDKVRGHLSNFQKFEDLYQNLNHEYKVLLNNIDPNFKKILRIVYSHRYYDDIKNERTFGFLVNQFLGELDYTVCMFETIFATMTVVEGNIDNTTSYAQNVRSNDKQLLENNYILHNIDKNEFMNRETYVYGVFVFKKNEKAILTNARKSKPGTMIKIKLKDNPNFEIELPKYNGQLFLIEMQPKQ